MLVEKAVACSLSTSNAGDACQENPAIWSVKGCDTSTEYDLKNTISFVSLSFHGHDVFNTEQTPQ